MNAVERAILREHYKLRKLAKIWRAIARRHLSCMRAPKCGRSCLITTMARLIREHIS